MAGQGGRLAFSILGPVEVTRDDEHIEIGGAKQRAVLAALLVAREAFVPLDRLIDDVWDEEPPRSAAGTLQAYISNLRKALEPEGRAAGYSVLPSSGRTYRLMTGGALDATRFEQLRASARDALAAGRAHDALPLLEEALGLWRGEALADLQEMFARAEATRLHELRRATQDDLLEAQLACGAYASVIADAEGLLRADPLHERTWAALMLALYRDGRQADALTAYQRARAYLAEELGVDPGPELRRLETEILAQAASLDAPASAAPIAVRPVDREPESPGEGASIVGREAEVARLDRLIAAAQHGSGRVAFLHGEPGIGKTRLLEELDLRATRAGVRVVWGHCIGGVKAPPLWPWRLVFDSLETSELGNLGALIAEDDPNATRADTYRSLALGLALRSADEPMIVIIDDAHWSDSPSMELLRFIGAEAAGARLLIVVAFREKEETPALAEAIAALTRDGRCERIRLGGLDADGVRGFVEVVCGVAPPHDLTDALLDRTEGNPFFLREIVHLLLTEGALDVRGQRAVLGVGVPLGVRDVIGRRIASLEEPTGTLLSLASVIGREFEVAVLARAADAAADEVLERLEPAGDLGIVMPVDAGRLRFSHDLIRETLYDATSPMRRARLHARVAEAMVELREHDPAYTQALAHHFYEGAAVTGPNKAVGFVLAAAAAADRTFAYEMTEDRLVQAMTLLDLLPPSEETMQLQLGTAARLARYRAIMRGYASVEAGEALERTRTLAEAMGVDVAVLISSWGLWGMHTVRAELDAGELYGMQMLERGHTAGDAWFHLGGHQALGTTMIHRGRFSEAIEHLSKALAICEGLDVTRLFEVFQQDPLVLSKSFLSVALAYDGRFDEGRPLVDEAVARAVEIGEQFSLGFAHFFDAWFGILEDNPERALRGASAGQHVADENGFEMWRAICPVIAGWARVRLGEIEAGLAEIERGARTLPETQIRMLAGTFLGMRAEAEFIDGRPERALELLDEADEHAERTGEHVESRRVALLRERITAGAKPARA